MSKKFNVSYLASALLSIQRKKLSTRPKRLMLTVLGGFALIGLWQFVMAPPIHSDVAAVANAPLRILADLGVAKTVNNTTPNAGEVITYTITVTNNDSDDATGVQLTDMLPTGVTFGGYTAIQGTYTSTTGLWTVGSLATAASATLTITATVDSGTGGMTITNTANILAADQPDPNLADNEDSAGISPTSVAMYGLYLPIIYRNYCSPFIDTFTSPSSGWPVVDNAALKTEYTGGEYRMLTKNPMLHYAYNTQFADYFTDYEIEVDARWADSTSTGKGYGIIFGLASDDSHAYLYQINADWQTYRLLLYSSGSWNPLTNNGTNNGWVYTDTINSGLNSNRLKVTRSGPQIILYVNNIYLETVVNDALISGRVGLSVQSYYNDPVYGTRNADARFDNYILNPCIGTVSSVRAAGNLSVSSPSTGALPRPD
jgi:uncharacterized repeat protein (TIGR01451 family)